MTKQEFIKGIIEEIIENNGCERISFSIHYHYSGGIWEQQDKASIFGFPLGTGLFEVSERFSEYLQEQFEKTYKDSGIEIKIEEFELKEGSLDIFVSIAIEIIKEFTVYQILAITVPFAIGWTTYKIIGAKFQKDLELKRIEIEDKKLNLEDKKLNLHQQHINVIEKALEKFGTEERKELLMSSMQELSEKELDTAYKMMVDNPLLKKMDEMSDEQTQVQIELENYKVEKTPSLNMNI